MSVMRGAPRKRGEGHDALPPANLPRDDLFIGGVSGNMSQIGKNLLSIHNARVSGHNRKGGGDSVALSDVLCGGNDGRWD
jgi:hypothetical protein